MTTRQFILVYAAGILGSFITPGFIAPLVIFGCVHFNGEIPLVVGEKGGRGT